MKRIEIKNWRTGDIIVCGKYKNIKNCLEKNRSANLSSVNLRYADLSYADLSSANLSYADLRSADLRYADLSYADLRSANLSYADLRSADLSYADLSSANLSYADLRYADLSSADLSYADLSSANLSYADLSYADLRSANLSYADLRSANLSYAKYKEPLFLPDLYLLKLLPQNFKLRAWKYLNNGGKSAYQGFDYSNPKKKIYKFPDYNSNEKELCSSGGNVATLIWCLKDNLEANEFMEVEFFVRDICAIPFATDGKFRVKKFRKIRVINREKALKFLKKAMGKNELHKYP